MILSMFFWLFLLLKLILPKLYQKQKKTEKIKKNTYFMILLWFCYDFFVIFLWFRTIIKKSSRSHKKKSKKIIKNHKIYIKFMKKIYQIKYKNIGQIIKKKIINKS